MPEQIRYRLGNSTVAEPLVNKWVAWSHLIPPIPYSLHLQQYQLNLLESYLRYPKVHLQSCKNPQLRYGPFVDIPAERVGEVRDLLNATKAQQSGNLELAQALIQFQNFLAKEAKGQSLEPYYERIPQPLRGYVELVYDYYHHPIVRLFERLLYESPYYQKGFQSFRIFQQKSDSSRPFFMSTPRLLEEDQIDWALPFDDPLIDEFFKLDVSPQPLGHIREILGLQASDEPRLLPLLSAQTASPPIEGWDGAGVRIRYIGHACALVECNGISILTDPWIGVMPQSGGVERITFADLPERIDYALITHGHPDHFGLETLLRLRHRIGQLVVPRAFGMFYGDISLKLLAEKIGFKNVVELETLDSISFPGGEIIGVPFMGEQADLPHGKSAYVIRVGDERVLFGADSNCLDVLMYQHLRRILGRIQTVFIGMECVGAPLSWMYQPFFPSKLEHSIDQSRRLLGCNANGAQQILEAVEAERIYVYAMGLEPWLEYLLGLAVPADSVQIKESNTLILNSRQRGLLDAQLLEGTRDIYLKHSAAGPTNTATA